MPKLPFTVDSKLLRELGERLVGAPHIALGELVKNSYDADASKVTIRLFPDTDLIEVRDDGHGMTLEEFESFWMRIGTTHKENRLSRYLGRQMTGSKGVGRLAVQFLAEKMKIVTVPREYRGQWLETKAVNWSDAVDVGDLTEATVEYEIQTSPPPFEHGTSIILNGLKNKWDTEDVRDLAREIWWLVPPFRTPSPGGSGDTFDIELEAAQEELERTFKTQINAIMRIWIARIVAKNEQGHVALSLEFAGETPQRYEYEIADLPHNDGIYDEEENLTNGAYEIRIYHLQNRQPHGIRVGEAREYFKKHGGVHVYDGGFRLPYYGDPKNDWLLIEYDHAHRKSRSGLLPESLQVPAGLSHLPTLSRFFGVVNVSTAREKNLDIMITRDRLKETKAYEDLWTMVRYGIDLYAMERARREFKRKAAEAGTEPPTEKLERVEDLLEHYQPEMPEEVYDQLQEGLREARSAARAERERALEEMGLLGSLATAGISALAYQHELNKQLNYVRGIIERIEEFEAGDAELRGFLKALSGDLSNWLDRAIAINSLFDYLADAENVRVRHRFRASAVLEEVKRETAFLARGIEVDVEVDEDLYLPEASLAEWESIFQNLFTNAYNAMVDSEVRQLSIASRSRGRLREILIQDTGVGVDLKDAERLFEPFVRGAEISPGRRALGYGGTGLGLTIVRLLADRIGCSVEFVEPEEEFSTAIAISWKETG